MTVLFTRPNQRPCIRAAVRTLIEHQCAAGRSCGSPAAWTPTLRAVRPGSYHSLQSVHRSKASLRFFAAQNIHRTIRFQSSFWAHPLCWVLLPELPGGGGGIESKDCGCCICHKSSFQFAWSQHGCTQTNSPVSGSDHVRFCHVSMENTFIEKCVQMQNMCMCSSMISAYKLYCFCAVWPNQRRKHLVCNCPPRWVIYVYYMFCTLTPHIARTS